MSGTKTVAGRPEGWALLRRAFRPYRRHAAVGITAALLWTAGKVAIPKLVATAIDQGMVAGRHGALVKWALVLLGLGLVSAACAGVRRYYAWSISWRVETDLREELYAHLQRLHFTFHDQAQTGQLMTRAATDLQQVQALVINVPITAANLVTLVAVTVILLLINVKLTLLALGALPLVMGAAKRFSSRTYPVSVDLQQRLAELATTVEESITGIRAVKGLGIERVQARRVQERSQAVYTTSMGATRIRSVFLPVLDFLPALALVAVLWYGGHEVVAGRLSVGQLVEFNYYVVTLIVPLRMIGVLVAQMERGVASAMRLEDIFSQKPQIADRPDAVALVDHRTRAGLGQIRFEHVRFGYDPTAPILDGLDLSIAPGEAGALVGSTASGKTTVARLIPRFYDVDAGRVLIDGADVRQIKLTDLRRAVGIVFQDTFLFSDTIRGNIAFADPLASSEQVEAAARLAGAHDFILEQPEGYDTEIGQGGLSLSGGQRQRLALARAILSDPRILILDDATSSVDPAKEHEIAGALAQVMAGRTTVIIAHRAATIALADRVVLLDGGRVVAEGTHGSLLRTSGRYRAVVGHASPSSPGPSLEAV